MPLRLPLTPDGGCTTKGGRPCAFSILGGTATDFQGNVWSGTGDVASELLTPISLNEVTVFENRNFLQKFRGKTTKASRKFFKPVRDFRSEFAENAAIVREAASEIARENIGSVYRAGAEYGLFGSGLGFGPSRLGNAFNNAARGSGRVFWSGGSQARLAAESFAKSNGLKTLEMTW